MGFWHSTEGFPCTCKPQLGGRQLAGSHILTSAIGCTASLVSSIESDFTKESSRNHLPMSRRQEFLIIPVVILTALKSKRIRVPGYGWHASVARVGKGLRNKSPHTHKLSALTRVPNVLYPALSLFEVDLLTVRQLHTLHLSCAVTVYLLCRTK